MIISAAKDALVTKGNWGREDCAAQHMLMADLKIPWAAYSHISKHAP